MARKNILKKLQAEKNILKEKIFLRELADDSYFLSDAYAKNALALRQINFKIEKLAAEERHEK